MTEPAYRPLVTIATTDFAAVTRGRPVFEDALARAALAGIGWTPANISLTPFNTIADPNPWGSRGDLSILADLAARYRSVSTGAATPFDLVLGDIVELDGAPCSACSRAFLKRALADLKARTGLSMTAAFEQEFQLASDGGPPAPAFSHEALRRADPFAPRLVACLTEAGVDPEMVLAEYGADQFEATHAPTDALQAADRAIAIREITREVARLLGRPATFSPKTSLDGVGNGVHIHFSFTHADGAPAAYAADRPGGLSEIAGAFCAGVLAHLPAFIALTASSVASYYRLKPHSWSASYTWIGERDREAALRICPVAGFGGRDPARQYNIEFRAADASANPYLALGAIVRAGLAGIEAGLAAPTLFAGDPGLLSEADRAAQGLRRLPESLDAALIAFEADATVAGWFEPVVRETFLGVKRAEIAALAGLEPVEICARYRAVY
jgi:glutamine synthetase